MKRLTQPNVLVRTKDGKIATTCYYHVDGVGIKYGRHWFAEGNYPEPDKIFIDYSDELTKVEES